MSGVFEFWRESEPTPPPPLSDTPPTFQQIPPELRFYPTTSPLPSSSAAPEKGPILAPGAWKALAKTVPVVVVALVPTVTAWGSVEGTWYHLLMAAGGGSAESGGHAAAGFIALAGFAFACKIDGPADNPNRHQLIRLHHAAYRIGVRVLRWGIAAGSLHVLPIALGLIHITTGVHA